MMINSNTGLNIRGWNTERKLHDVLTEHRRKCSCGHTITTLPASKHHKEYIVCNWCGKKVFKDEEKQKEYERQLKRENFRTEMWRVLKNG